eukprot:63328_1
MGFNESLSSEAAKKYKNNINRAIEYVLSNSTEVEEQKVHQNIANIDKNCLGAVSNCDYLEDLSIVVHNYMKDNFDLNKVQIDSVLNDFLHLISKHSDEFELIYAKLNSALCTVVDCQAFWRNHRNRNISAQNKELPSVSYDTNDNKIHCHYLHCYDIGYRLTDREKNTVSNRKHTNELIKLISDKHKIYSQIHDKLGRVSHSKFVTVIEDKHNDEDQKMNQCQLHENNNLDMYNFGIQFHYGPGLGGKIKYVTGKGYTQIVPSYEGKYLHGKGYVTNKYKSFKEELILKESNVILPEQFINELGKAKKYFASYYCQKILISKIQHDNRSKAPLCAVNVEIGIEDGEIQRFYHGIGEKLLFPLQQQNPIEIPLSTSSQMEVAVNFASHKGLMVEFGQQNVGCNCYFASAWCSDYGNESEHIFIQNGSGLIFRNIVDVITGCEFGNILGAMNLLNNLQYLPEKYTETKAEIAIKLIKHEINTEEWTDLHIYAQTLFHQYCVSVDYIIIDWEKFSMKYTKIYELFRSTKFDGINISLLNTLYPMLGSISTMNMQIHPLILYDIFNHLKSSKQSKINEIRMWLPKTSGLYFNGIKIDDVVTMYKAQFI